MLWVVVLPTIVKPTDGVSIALLVFLCLLFLKVLLDDAAHFNDKKKSGENWYHGLGLCILWNILMLHAIQVAAGDRNRSLMYAISALFCGTAWMVQNYIHKASDTAGTDKQRYVGCGFINLLSVVVLTIVNTYLRTAPKELSLDLLIGLSFLVIFEVLYFGTLKRVSGAFN